MPSLSERIEDIPLLAEHFLSQLARKLGRNAPRLTLANVQELQRHDWPGNIRELQHMLERAMITSSSRKGKLRFNLEDSPASGSFTKNTADYDTAQEAGNILTSSELRNLETSNIRRALARTGGKIYGAGGAAELLDMKPTTLASRIKSLGIVATR